MKPSPRKEASRSAMAVAVSLLIVSWIIAFSACSSTEHGLAPINPPSISLPSLAQLDEIDKHPTYTNEAIHTKLGSASYLASANSSIIDNRIVLNSSSNGISYSIYQFGQFFADDALLTISVDSDQTGIEEPHGDEYYIAISHYESGSWKVSGPYKATGDREISPPVNIGLISDAQFCYLAIITTETHAISVNSITATFQLAGRLLDHLDSLMPAHDTTHVNVAIKMNAVDKAGFPVFGFNGSGEIVSIPEGITLVSQPAFTEGYGKATVIFPTTGTYKLQLINCDPKLDGLIGEINVYETKLPIYSISIDRQSLNELNWNPWSDEYRRGDINIDGVSFNDIRMRYRGGSSRNFPKKNWKVKLETENQYNDPDWQYTRKTLNLNAEYTDRSLMREMLSYQVLLDLDVLTPRARFIHLRVNDEFMGVYVDVENPRTDWLVEFSLNDQGAMYKAKSNYFNELESTEAYIGPFEKETREDEPFDDIAAFVHAVNSWDDTEVLTEMPKWLDIDAYTKYMVGNSLVSQGDHMWKNYYAYYDEFGSGKWIIFPWDYDLTWGHIWTEENYLFDTTMFFHMPLNTGNYNLHGYGNMLMTRYLENPVFTAQFKAGVGVALSTVFTEQRMLDLINNYEISIKDDALADPNKWGKSSDWYLRVDELREYVIERRQYLTENI